MVEERRVGLIVGWPVRCERERRLKRRIRWCFNLVDRIYGMIVSFASSNRGDRWGKHSVKNLKSPHPYLLSVHSRTKIMLHSPINPDD
jgi:hypothetical protein